MAKVLIVDDSALNRALVSTLLTNAGHHSIEAADGIAGLANVRAERPDLVICDIVLPTIDGYEFVRRLRADGEVARTKVIFYSATFLEREARDLARSCGVSRVLTKPCSSQELLQTVDQALSDATPSEAGPIDSEFDREHLRLLTDKLVGKANELEGANLRLSALTDLNLQLASERDPHALLDKVCRGARDLVGARIAVLAVKDESSNGLATFTTCGMDAEDTTWLGQLAIDAGVPDQVLMERRPRRFSNPSGNPLDAGLSGDYPSVHSGLIVPILSPGHAHGWIFLIDKLGAQEFTEEDERLLSILAAQAGRIYENSRLYVEMKRSAELLQAEVAERGRIEDVLRERDAGLRHAQTMAKLAHVVTRPDGSFEDWSETLPQLIGVAPTDMPKSTRAWLAILHPEDRPMFRSKVIAAGVSGTRTDVEYRLRRADGEWVDMRQAIEPIPGTAGADGRLRWFCTLQDVTEQKKVETRVKRLNRVYAVLSGINSLIVRVRDREELFHDACRIAVDAGAFRMAWIGVIDPQTLDGKVVASYGEKDSHALYIRLTARDATPESDRPASRAVRSRSPVICNDISTEALVGPMRDELLSRGHRSFACLPLILDGEAVAVLGLLSGEIGAFDDDETRLLLELAGDIAFALDHIEKEERLNYLAYYDSLTGLANSTLLHERLEQFISAAGAENEKLALMLIDLERFTTINDTFGRHVGDALLRQLAERLTDCVPDRKQLARIGADHFAIVVPDVQSEGDLVRMVDDRFRRCFHDPFRMASTDLRISARFGIALYPNDAVAAQTLYRNAEAALKKAKASSERVLFYSPRMTEAVAQKLALENKLRQALENEEFLLFYQPKVDVDTRRIEGVEALIRWRSPELGLVPPMQFIPLMEETGLILEVGAWALRRAVLDHKNWLEQGLSAPRVAVNVSAVQLRKLDFVATVLDALKLGAALPGIDIEITESLIMEDIQPTIEKLHALRALGMDISIDDFGTGYSSLAYLAKLPVQVLKIDRAFISTMLTSPDNMTLVSMMIGLAHALRLKVVAEGVEVEEEARMLNLLRCDQMQGYLVGKPVPFEDMSALIRNAEKRSTVWADL